jgi:transposase
MDARHHLQRRSWIASRFAPPIKRGGKGYDAGKKITGRKRHILTDTDGRLLAVRVHAGDVQDRDGGKLPLKLSRARYPFLTRVYADGGYAGRLVTWATNKTHITLEIIRWEARAKGFEVLPRRWVVERTFGWIFKNRRYCSYIRPALDKAGCQALTQLTLAALHAGPRI